MSGLAAYDEYLDPPEECAWCEDHDQPRPCRLCRMEALIEQAEERYKEGGL